MIARAEAALAAKGLSNVRLVTMSAFDLTRERLQEITTKQQAELDMVVCSHGFSAMDNPEPIFRHTLSLLKRGGRYLIMDEYYAERNVLTVLSRHLFDRWFLGSNQFSRPWLLLENELTHFVKYDRPFKNFGIVPGNYYVAGGFKSLSETGWSWGNTFHIAEPVR